jgi:hypothetical protein
MSNTFWQSCDEIGSSGLILHCDPLFAFFKAARALDDERVHFSLHFLALQTFYLYNK